MAQRKAPAMISELPAFACSRRKAPAPPGTLSREARRWWRALQDEYSIEDEGGMLLLQTALEAFDRMRSAQQIIATEGMMLADRFGQPKPHPLLTTERDARSALLQAMKALQLDFEPLHPRPGRPAGS